VRKEQWREASKEGRKALKGLRPPDLGGS